jgi:hypothetical protein
MHVWRWLFIGFNACFFLGTLRHSFTAVNVFGEREVESIPGKPWWCVWQLVGVGLVLWLNVSSLHLIWWAIVGLVPCKFLNTFLRRRRSMRVNPVDHVTPMPLFDRPSLGQEFLLEKRRLREAMVIKFLMAQYMLGLPVEELDRLRTLSEDEWARMENEALEPARLLGRERLEQLVDDHYKGLEAEGELRRGIPAYEEYFKYIDFIGRT